jgi:hypothetical protein
MRKDWPRDSQVLQEIGRFFDNQGSLAMEVRLSRSLAEAALAAWERDDEVATVGDLTRVETPEEKRLRHRAGTLALIGLELSQQGLGSADEVTVSLRAVLIGQALEAAWNDD